MSDISSRVKEIVAEQLTISGKEISNEASFVEDLGADSLDTVEIVIKIEEEFNIEIPDEESQKINTIQQAVDYIESHIKESA